MRLNLIAAQYSRFWMYFTPFIVAILLIFIQANRIYTDFRGGLTFMCVILATVLHWVVKDIKMIDAYRTFYNQIYNYPLNPTESIETLKQINQCLDMDH